MSEHAGNGTERQVRALVVDDEETILEFLGMGLGYEGFTVETAQDGRAALAAAARERPELVILDVMLPGFDGLEVCRRIRRARITPILMLTAKSTELDKVLGLELGADDYLTKPVAIRELRARVTAILRRVEMMREESRALEDTLRPVVHDGLRIDPVGREVVAADRPVTLTAKEFDLLYLLAANAGRVFSRDYLLDRLWGNDYGGFDRTVDTHILRIRRKLGGPGSPADRIVTLWGVGYKYQRLTKGVG